ncbi:MAG: tRNA1(Val) (adenine(37)-N6)-methyltransferase [Lachnospiraceae bacterium]|nr:tRNA1(Val) (adenine(37)-N6)-methyltransferase [Lachnospiraceae bacterium]
MSERIDDLQIKGYKLIQNPDLFCFGVDAVLLSDFARAQKTDKVIDLCTGNGIIPVLLAAKTEAESIVGLEIQEESAGLAKRSVELNRLESRISIVQGDVKEADVLFGASSFDVVTCNPPYMNDNHGIKNDFTPKAIARHEIMCTLEDVISKSARLLKPGGNLFMVHRPHRLIEIIALLRQYRIEPKRLRFVHPYVSKEPTMVLIEANRGGKANLRVDAPLIIYEDVNKYTEEIYEIYGMTGP